MPPKTLLFSVLIQDLGDQPGFTDQLMATFGKTARTGPAMMTPALVEMLGREVTNKRWEDLDRFPGTNMREIGAFAGAYETSSKVERGPLTVPGMAIVTKYADAGGYDLATTSTVDLNQPSELPGLPTEGATKPLLYDVVEGDGPNPALAPMHSESARLAQVLTRLAMNGVDGVAPVEVKIGDTTTTSPEGLVRALVASGHQVEVADARYFANFGHLHYDGYDVMMPFWVNAGVYVPGTQRPLLVPVSHAEYEWRVRGPKINADVAFYFGIDGKAQFRTMDTLDQAWVMGRRAHVYRGAEAAEVTRLSGLVAIAYSHLHVANPGLVFGGYYTLGVCQDGISAIERKMTGTSTLFPLTAAPGIFHDPRDGEINALMGSLPNDREGAAPEMERLFGSLPTEDLDHISIPRLGADLKSVRKAWLDGSLEGSPPDPWKWPVLIGVVAAALLGSLWLARRRRHLREQALRGDL